MLELTDWVIRRAGREVARVSELKVRRGEVVGLVGPSGKGKSSVLAALSNTGAAKPVSGELKWERGARAPGDLVAATRCAALFDDRPDAPDLSVTDWLAYHAAACGAPAQGPEVAMKALGLKAVAELPVGTLSGGMAERLLLARLLLRPPELVLIDHPLARLDAAGEFALASLFDRLRADRAAVLWAATDQARLERHCDRLVHL